MKYFIMQEEVRKLRNSISDLIFDERSKYGLKTSHDQFIRSHSKAKDLREHARCYKLKTEL